VQKGTKAYFAHTHLLVVHFTKLTCDYESAIAVDSVIDWMELAEIGPNWQPKFAIRDAANSLGCYQCGDLN